MNLRQIIRESINSVILDSIISDAILNEVTLNEKNHNAGKKKQRGYNRKQKQQNLQQKRQQNVSKTVKAPQGGVTQTPQDSARQTNTTNQQQATPQNQQKPTVDFGQYADELRKIVGNNGIDPKPVQNNKAAVQHIDKLNHFVFAVINSIDSNNIDGVNAPAVGDNSKWINPYGKDRVDMGRDAMRASVNYLGNNAENLLGKGANNPFNGVFRAGVDAYNNTNNLFTQQINNREYEKLYNNSSRNGNAGGGLTYLMQSVNDGCYPRLQTEYHQINQQNNNIFSATPDVGNCYQILLALSVAVTAHANSQKQQNTQQPNSGQPNVGQSNGGQSNVGQPNGGNNQPGDGTQSNSSTKTGGKVNTAKKSPIDDAVKKAATNPLDEDWDKTVDELATLQQECHNLSYQKNMNDGIKNLFEWNANFLKNVISASDNEDEEELMNLLSVNSKDDDNIGTYNWIKSGYEYTLKQYGKDPQEGGYLKTLYKVLAYSNVLRSQLTLLQNNNR